MSTDSRTSEEIERDLERERAQLASSLEALQERFSIEGVTRQVADQLRRHGGEFGQSALESAKSNPVALALTGIGLAWMMVSDTRRNGGRTSGSFEHGMSTTAPNAEAESPGSQRWDRMRTGASRQGSQARSTAADLRNRLYEGTEHLSETARKRIVEAREAAYRRQSELERAAGNGGGQLRDLYKEQPIVVGAMAFALGAALGASLPRTNAEDSTVGESSDRLFAEAERVFREETEKAETALKSASSESTAERGQTQGRASGDGSRDREKAGRSQPGPSAPSKTSK